MKAIVQSGYGSPAALALREVDRPVAAQQPGHEGHAEGAARTGKLTPIIDRTYPLAQVPEAIRYLAEGNRRGRIIVTV
jgi:hypothetical protein